MVKAIKGLFSFLKDLPQSVKITIIGTGIMQWGSQLTRRYDQLYAADLGANPVDLGILSSISSAVSAFISFPMGWAAERHSVKKVMLLGLALFAVHSTLLALAGNWWMLIPAYIISRRLARMMPLSDVIFVTATAPQRRATIMSLSRVFWALLSTFAPLIAAFIVAYSGGINAQGIRPLYYLQLFTTLSVFLLIFWKLPPKLDRIEKKNELGSKITTLLQDYRDLFKGEKYLPRWVVIRFIRQFANSLAITFVSLWLVNVKGATPYIIGAITSVGLISSLIFQTPAGWLADKIGRKKIVFLFRPISYIGTLLVILTPRPEYLILAGLIGASALGSETMGGGISGVSFPAFITMYWEVVPDEKRGRWFGVEGLYTLASIPGSIIGGILWQKGFMIEVMLLPIALELLIMLPLLATVPETLRPKP